MKRSIKHRREATLRGQVELSNQAVAAIVKQFPRLTHLQDSWEYRNDQELIYIPVKRFKQAELEFLVEFMLKETPQPRATIAQVRMHLEILANPGDKPISSLMAFETAMLAYLREDIVRGWLFMNLRSAMRLEETSNMRDEVAPVLVTSVQYHPPERTRDDFIPARVRMKAMYWMAGKERSCGHTFHQGDMGRTVRDILLDAGFVHESPELVDLHERDESTYLQWRTQLGKQFLGTGEFYHELDGYRSSGRSNYDMRSTRLVIDDECHKLSSLHTATEIFSEYESTNDRDADEDTAETRDRYTRMPIYPYIECFNLASHNEGYVHVRHMKPYVYNPKLREKLILKPEHDDLIDALTADMDILMEDIVSGKTGGTTIICQGPAGTGKTLTAEVYSEVVERPLYRIHSGQLGIEAEGVEKVLLEAMERARRWKAILLIDEADVFLMERGTDLALNAVVGVFLRVLEYYEGLTFLTTNRMDSIDDAILSRCIARIEFQHPSAEELKRLWQTLGEVYDFKLIREKGVLEQLVKLFPKASGRDVKGLIRLVTKYARQRKRAVKLEDVKRMAVFRGM